MEGRRAAAARGGVWRGGVTLFAFAMLLATVSACARPERHTMEMRGFEFIPATVTVAAGDTIEFINRDMVPHTATAAGRGWDSGQIQAGATWSFVAREQGEFPYLCTLHPSMTGTLVVR